MRISELVMLACLLSVAGPGARAASGQMGATCTYTMRLEVAPAQATAGASAAAKAIEVQGRAWQLGKKARIEMATQGHGGRIVILTPDAVYSLQPDRNIATRKPMTPQAAGRLYYGFPLIFLHPVDPATQWKGATKSGTETVAGVVCDIWKVVLPGTGGQETSLWVPRSKHPTAPVKASVAMVTPALVGGRATAGGPRITCTVIANDVKLNRPVAASLFTVPKGYVVQSAPSTGARAHRTTAMPRQPSRGSYAGPTARR